MLKILICVLVLTLSACSSAPTKPLARTMDRHTMTVTWVRTQPSMPDGGHCPSRSSGGILMVGGRTLGCAQVTGPDTCTIWAVEPREVLDEFNMGIIGHEMLHCFLGEFHS
jgi:hypothetical protein